MVAKIAEQPFTVANIPLDSWSFAIRVWLAMILALFVSFWLQLEAPASAAVTVGILAEPTRGQALDKAGFRLLATGCRAPALECPDTSESHLPHRRRRCGPSNGSLAFFKISGRKNSGRLDRRSSYRQASTYNQ